MRFKWIGAVLVILGCGGCGCSLVADQRRQERLVQELQQAVAFMVSELQYRLTPLPELCALAGGEVSGVTRQIFQELAAMLDGAIAPEVSECMKEVLRNHRELPTNIRRLHQQLGRSLGRFDLPGQLQGLNAIQKACQREHHRLSENREERMRSCQTLCLCAGAALVILFA